MTYDYALTEQRAHHPGAEATSAIASIAKNAAYGARENARLLAGHTQWWSSTPHTNGFLNVAHVIVGQAGATWSTWSTLYRGLIRVPAVARRIRARCIMGPVLSDSLVVQARLRIDGDSTWTLTPIAQVASSAMSVTTNVATATLPSGHGIAEGTVIYTSGFTTNVGDAAPVLVTLSTDSTIQYPLSTTNGPKGSGIIWVRDMLRFDTARNDENGGIIGPEFGDLALYPFQEQGMTPIVVETWATAISRSDSAIICEARVEVRSWVAIQKMANSPPLPFVPLATYLYAEKDEDGDYVESLFSAGSPIIQTSLESLKAYVDSSIEDSPITHMAFACGSAGWEEAATAGTAAPCRPDTGIYTGGMIVDQEIWLDYAAPLEGGVLYVVTGGTWTLSVTAGGSSTSFTGITTSRDWGAGERTFTLTSPGNGWSRVTVTATRTAGSGDFELRHFRLSEACSASATPADD